MTVELPKLEETFVAIDSGRITTPIQKGQNSLSDQTKMWRAGVFVNHLVRVTDSAGRREIELIADNAGSSIVIRDTWTLNFPVGSEYEILGVSMMGALIGAYPGMPYSNSDTATNDEPRRFETTQLILRDAVIRNNSQFSQQLGGIDAQEFELPGAAEIGIQFLDLSQFYFRNTTPGSNGTIEIFGTRCWTWPG